MRIHNHNGRQFLVINGSGRMKVAAQAKRNHLRLVINKATGRLQPHASERESVLSVGQ